MQLPRWGPDACLHVIVGYIHASPRSTPARSEASMAGPAALVLSGMSTTGREAPNGRGREHGGGVMIVIYDDRMISSGRINAQRQGSES